MKIDIEKDNNVMLGTWSWGDEGFFGEGFSREELFSVFRKAVSEGFTLWDTAYVYGYGRSEELLGGFMKELPSDDYCISDKFTPYHAKEFPGNSVKLMFEESVRHLGREHIDIYWIHNPIEYKKWLPYLAELRDEGYISEIGLSNFGLGELKTSEEILSEYGIKPYGVQNHYSLLSRSSETSGIIDYCKEKGIHFFSYMVLEQGALTGKYAASNPFRESSGRAKNYNKVLPKYEELNEKLEKLAENYGISIAAFSIAWALSKGTIPIIGVTKERHIDDIQAARKVKLSTDDITAAEEAAAVSGLRTIRMWEREYR